MQYSTTSPMTAYQRYVDFLTIKPCPVYGKKHRYADKTTEPSSETSYFIKGTCACGEEKVLDLVSKF